MENQMMINSLGQLVHSDHPFVPMYGVSKIESVFCPNLFGYTFMVYDDLIRVRDN